MTTSFPKLSGRPSLVLRFSQLATALLFIVMMLPARAASLEGRLEITGQSSSRLLKNVKVTLYEATEFAPIALAEATTDGSGRFQIELGRESSKSIFFLKAHIHRQVAFLCILGEELPERAIINEISTVAASYSMAQFYRTGDISGDSFRLRIAKGMYHNIVNAETGRISDVLTTSPNADQTISLRLTRSLANVLNSCARRKAYSAFFLRLATANESRQRPDDTAEALANLARNPAAFPDRIYRLSRRSNAFSPALTEAPDQWSVTIKLNDTGREDIPFGGAANVDWDSWGYAWVSNNVVQGTPNSTSYNVVLRPDGKPADGTGGEPVSPFNTGGLLGVGWGVSVDRNDNVWFGNYGWGKPKSTTYPSQTTDDREGAGTGSVSRFLGDGTATNDIGYFGPFRVQGIEPDSYDNIWMASFGDRFRPRGSGVWVYKDGNPEDSAHSLVDWEDAPFGIAPVPDGRAAWVTFSGGLAGEHQSSIAKYELTSAGELTQLFAHPVGDTLKVVEVDFGGNAWFASQGTNSVFAYDPHGNKLGEFKGGGIDGPWGLTVDGEGNIWVSNFGPTEIDNDFNLGRLSKLCGANPSAWPKGLTMGDPISPKTGYTVPSAGDPVLLPNGDPLYGPGAPASFAPMMRQTSVKIDAAGNVWTINNWKPRFDVDITTNPGGDGIIIFVGLAPPLP